jgi:hypothetical protein
MPATQLSPSSESPVSGRRPAGESADPSSGSIEACCLLVMEAGSRWPTWLEAPPAGRIVAQNSDETPSEFSSRVLRAMRSIQNLGQALDAVVIAAGWTSDDEQSLFGRSLIAKAAARAMDGRPGMVLLSGHDRLPESARHELLATACALANQLVGTGIDVRVRFETTRTGPRTVRPSPTSGVFERAEPALESAEAEDSQATPSAEAPVASQTRPVGTDGRRSKRGRQDPAQVA